MKKLSLVLRTVIGHDVVSCTLVEIGRRTMCCSGFFFSLFLPLSVSTDIVLAMVTKKWIGCDNLALGCVMFLHGQTTGESAFLHPKHVY